MSSDVPDTSSENQRNGCDDSRHNHPPYRGDFQADWEFHKSGVLALFRSHPSSDVDNIDIFKMLRLRQTENKDVPLLLLTDGIGPAPNGERASQQFIESFCKEAPSILSSTDPLGLTLFFSGIFDRAAESVRKLASTEKRPLGCSALSCLIHEGTMHYAWAGNVRLYLFGNESSAADRAIVPPGILQRIRYRMRKLLSPSRTRIPRGGLERSALSFQNASLTRLTDDHTFAFRLMQEGKLTEQEMLHFPNRKFVTGAAGVRDGLSSDAGAIHVYPGDLILALTDGIHNVFTGHDLQELLRQFTSESLDRVLSGTGTDSRSSHDFFRTYLSELATRLGREARARGSDEFLTLALFLVTE